MKKLSFFVLAFMAITLAFTSCENGEKKAATTDSAAMSPEVVDTTKVDTAAGKGPIVPAKD